MVVADKTSELYQKTYWASYNIPYVPTPIPASPLLSFPYWSGVLPHGIFSTHRAKNLLWPFCGQESPASFGIRLWSSGLCP